VNTASTAALLARIADADASIEARVAAAEELAARGDPRLDDDAMIAIAAGTLKRKRSIDSPVEPTAVEAFRIAPHLVTVKSYRELVDAGGYDDASLWSTEGWSWRIEHGIDAPRFWDEPEWAPYLLDSRPVVGVSAHEAEAYAAFRSARLPSELEWERACRGDDARDYPWGQLWQDDACGHRDHGPRCTLPIGVFPRGLSPFGLHDMVGNVWQWTADARPAGERIVCGGAWNNLPWSIGCAGRNAFAPDARFSNLGFRLAGD
jgi:formylglycine-generating enzyme required for sulfatase activity